MTPEIVNHASSLTFSNSQVMVVPGVKLVCCPTTVYCDFSSA